MMLSIMSYLTAAPIFLLFALPGRCFSFVLPVQTAQSHVYQQRLSASTQLDHDSSASTHSKLPGRPTSRLARFFFDDSVRLLNPKTMGSYQIKRTEQYGPIFKTNIFFRPTVFCTDRTHVQELASEEATKDLQAFFPPHHQTLFGKQSLLVQSGETHARLRRLIQPSLSPTVIQSYKGVVDSCVTSQFQEWKETVTDYEAMVPKIRSFFISMTLRVVLGTSDQPADELAIDIETWAKGLLAPPLTFIPWSTAAKAIRARKRIVEKLDTILQQQQQQQQQQDDGLLNRLVSTRDDDGNALSHDEIVDNVLGILFAGSDTTASATVSLWKVLSLYPNLKSELQNASAETCDAVIDQVLASFPPAPFSMRLAKQDVNVDDYTIPSDWLVIYGFAGTLLNENTETQWIVDSIQSANTAKAAASLAFGAGPRKCPGRYLACMEISAFLQSLLNTDWKLDPDQDLEQRYTPGYFPKDGFRVKFL